VCETACKAVYAGSIPTLASIRHSANRACPYLVRSRNGGRTYELRVKHSRLPKPVYHTFDVHEDAQRAGLQALVALDRGETP
jgi:hypothetical protein